MRNNERSGALREELEHRIRTGRCVYCRAPAAPDRPLTREHVIPRARGGRRKDSRIIVPACARCNQRRGCQEIVLFLLARPHRITAFLEYLSTLPPHTVREIDPRVFAELYAAVWLLAEAAAEGGSPRDTLRHLCAGRRLHRRRYAARRIVLAVGVRLARGRRRDDDAEGPTCLVGPGAGAPMAALAASLAMLWGVPAERVLRELSSERERVTAGGEIPLDTGVPGIPDVEEEDGVLRLDGWRPRARRRRTRVDPRGGGGGGGRYARGRRAA